jgi:phosphate transport system protein
MLLAGTDEVGLERKHMTPGIRSHFDQALAQLGEQMMDLGSRARQGVELGVRAFVDNDVSLAQQVIDADKPINELRYRIEEQCYEMLAMEQPVATDLRTIVAALVIANEFERVGDHGKKMARIAIRTASDLRPIPFSGILRMAELVLAMLDRTLAALADRDADEARAICLVDDQIDAYYKQLFNVSLSYMLEDPRAISASTYQIQVAHELERVGDRATNVCERLVYAVTGELMDLNP